MYKKVLSNLYFIHVHLKRYSVQLMTRQILSDCILLFTRRPVPISELFFNVKNAMFILKRYVYFVLYTKLEKEQCFRFI